MPLRTAITVTLTALCITGCGATDQQLGQLGNDAEASKRMDAHDARNAARTVPAGFQLVTNHGYSWLVPSGYEVKVQENPGVEDIVYIFPKGEMEKTKPLKMRITYWFAGNGGPEERKRPLQAVLKANYVTPEVEGGVVSPTQQLATPTGVRFDKAAYTFQNNPGFVVTSTSDDGISAWTEEELPHSLPITPTVLADYEKVVLSTKKD